MYLHNDILDGLYGGPYAFGTQTHLSVDNNYAKHALENANKI